MTSFDDLLAEKRVDELLPGDPGAADRYAAWPPAVIAALALLLVGVGGCDRPPAPSTLTREQASAAYDPVFGRVRDQLAADLGWTWTVVARASDKSWGSGECRYVTDTLRVPVDISSPETMQRVRTSVDKALAGTDFRDATVTLGGTGGWTTLVVLDGQGARLEASSKGYTELSLGLSLVASSCAGTTTR